MSPQLQSAHTKLLATDPARLPEPLRAALLNKPLFSMEVQLAGDGFAPLRWPELPADAPRDLFCKLGIKSWRDSGSLQPILRGMPLKTMAEHLLANPTDAQRTVAKAWLASGTPLMLQAFAYADFSQVSEARWLTSPVAVSLVSACQRGSSAPLLASTMPAMRRLALQMATHLRPSRHIIELACLPSGELRLIEVNPGLTPAELRALLAS